MTRCWEGVGLGRDRLWLRGPRQNVHWASCSTHSPVGGSEPADGFPGLARRGETGAGGFSATGSFRRLFSVLRGCPEH